MEKARLLVQGIVQGVGFRPTVFRTAKELELNGYVRNLGNIVEIVLEGSKSEIIQFSDILKAKRGGKCEQFGYNCYLYWSCSVSIYSAAKYHNSFIYKIKNKKVNQKI